MTKRQSRILMGAFAWTTYVWVSRLVIMAGQDESTGFKVVHAVLAVISLAFGVAVGKIGWDHRGAKGDITSQPETSQPETSQPETSQPETSHHRAPVR